MASGPVSDTTRVPSAVPVLRGGQGGGTAPMRAVQYPPSMSHYKIVAGSKVR